MGFGDVRVKLTGRPGADSTNCLQACLARAGTRRQPVQGISLCDV